MQFTNLETAISDLLRKLPKMALPASMESVGAAKSVDKKNEGGQQRHYNKWSLLSVDDCRPGPQRLAAEVSSLPNMPYMSMSMPLTRSTSAIASLQDIREIRSNLPRQLKYSFWQR